MIFISRMDASIQRSKQYISSNYAHNGKIMLSAAVILLVLVLVILCFHIYSKWRLHCWRRHNDMRRRQDDPEAIVTVSSEGLDVSVLSALPTFVYSGTSSTINSALECAVCLSEFEDSEKGRVLPKCNHSFHVECIDMWFYSHSNCPLCRAPVQLADILCGGTDRRISKQATFIEPQG